MFKVILVVLVLVTFISTLEGAGKDGGTKHIWKRENNEKGVRVPRKEYCNELKTTLRSHLYCENVKEEDRARCGKTSNPSKEECLSLGCCYHEDMSGGTPNCYHPSLKVDSRVEKQGKVRNLMTKIQKYCSSIKNRK